MSCPPVLIKGEIPLFFPHLIQPILYLYPNWGALPALRFVIFLRHAKEATQASCTFKSFAYCRKIITTPAIISRHFKRGYQRKIRIHKKDKQERPIDSFLEKRIDCMFIPRRRPSCLHWQETCACAKTISHEPIRQKSPLFWSGFYSVI